MSSIFQAICPSRSLNGESSSLPLWVHQWVLKRAMSSLYAVECKLDTSPCTSACHTCHVLRWHWSLKSPSPLEQITALQSLPIHPRTFNSACGVLGVSQISFAPVSWKTPGRNPSKHGYLTRVQIYSSRCAVCLRGKPFPGKISPITSIASVKCRLLFLSNCAIKI